MITDFLDSLPVDILNRSKTLDLRIRSVNAHAAIDDVLARTVFKGGKRLRPLLTYLVANLYRLDLDRVTPFARATELVHAASLSHDDVIDNATIRRGLPSINILASNKKAVLAGDYLLSSVIIDLTTTGELALVQEMALVIKDLSEGEWLQLDLITSRAYSRELIREIAAKKTSSVMSYCTVAPAILAKTSTEVQEISRQFGVSLGLAFQLIDDTLDYSGESLKDRELDVKNGIVNAVIFELLATHPDLMKRFQNGEDLTGLFDAVDFAPAIDNIRQEAFEHLNQARLSLAKLEVLLGSTLYQDEYLDDHQAEYQDKAEQSGGPMALQQALQHLELIISFMALRQH